MWSHVHHHWGRREPGGERQTSLPCLYVNIHALNLFSLSLSLHAHTHTTTQGLAGDYVSPSPSWSAEREASYGHGTLDVVNATHAVWTWHRNQDNVLMSRPGVVLTRGVKGKACSPSGLLLGGAPTHKGRRKLSAFLDEDYEDLWDEGEKGKGKGSSDDAGWGDEDGEASYEFKEYEDYDEYDEEYDYGSEDDAHYSNYDYDPHYIDAIEYLVRCTHHCFARPLSVSPPSEVILAPPLLLNHTPYKD